MSTEIARNEPCPCGSGKKYKRCCGVGAAPKVTPPKNPTANPMGGMPGGGGFDPSQFDPAMMAQFSQMFSRLPKGQMQRLQAIMSKAMAGKDVTREAAELESSLPLEMQQMLRGFQMPGAAGAEEPPALESQPMPQAKAPSGSIMSEEEARRIVEQAAKSGDLSQSEAAQVLGEDQAKKKGFWGKLTGKK